MIDFFEPSPEEELSFEKDKTVQGKVMEAIEWSFAYHGKAPSVREICRRCGYSAPSTVAVALDNLEKKGYIIRSAEKSRNIRLTNKRWFF